MDRALHVTRVRSTPPPSLNLRRGVLAYLQIEVGGLQLDGVVLRRTRSGRLALGFPARRDSSGRRRFYVRPLDDLARRSIERQVLELPDIEREVGS